jgi:signal transduction histidine kinase
VILATARVEWLGAGATIASLLPVQAEFSRIELAAQANLVRVLTHEIMNSLTPVISLARSGAELVADAAANDPSLRVAQNAVETLAARADGILRFVESYRDFAFSPELRRQHFAAKAWADQIAVVALADIQDGTAAVTVKVDPLHITVDGDPNLLAQVILNLIRNAVLAKARRVEVRVGWTQGKGVAIEVADDGPGIPLDRREDVFLPFYTTRRHGSGVGLSFARQIALAHGGSISAGDADLGGASILLSL